MEKLVEKYRKEIKTKLFTELNKKNIFDVPKIEKVVVSVGIGDYKEQKEVIEKISAEVSRVTGQKPKVNLSKKAVSAFKLRIGQPVGLTVTLRGSRMYDFIDKLVNLSLPRVRDFRGLSNSAFDGKGNYSIGIREYSIFPEIKYENIGMMFGFQINIKTNAKNDEEAKVLLTSLGFPFEKK
jgi:large subunit ribosomal protein L5